MSSLSKIALALEMIENAESTIRSAKQMLTEVVGKTSKDNLEKVATTLSAPALSDEGTVIEGVFTGQVMIGSDDNTYPVPANYASKSKLVPGDVLKLTIRDDGGLLYKQIGPVERKNLVGALIYEDGKYKVLAGGKLYNVLLASVTYYRGTPGDKVSLVVPANEESEWGAIEAILPSE